MHSIIDSNNQKSMLELFKSVWNWANAKIIKKTIAYNKAWFMFSLDVIYQDAWYITM